MHARVIHANIADLAEAKRSLDEEVIQGIKGPPGFLGAYFTAVDDSRRNLHRGVRDRRAGPRTAPPEGAEAPGVTVGTIQFGAVIGSA